MKRPKLLIVVTEDWYFWSHRLPIARAAQQDGYEVVIAAYVTSFGQEICKEGFRLVPLQISRGSYSPLDALRAVRQLMRIYRDEQPDIIHHVALKPILYGSLAVIPRKDVCVINAMAGLGYLAVSSSLKARFLRLIIWRAFRFLLNRPRHYVLLQNNDDAKLLATAMRVKRDRIAIIRGSGVDVNRFQPGPEPSSDPVILLASRMLWIKGIQEFVDAASLLLSKGFVARFVLVGDSDPKNHSCVPRQQILEWQRSGTVHWWGLRQDMPQVLKQSNLVCLPSHGGEGVPKVLIEAAACGRAIVTTDVPGCRDIVRDGVNGLLVPPKNVAALADAIQRLATDPEQRRQMGVRGRELVLREFSENAVTAQTLDLYRQVLGPHTPSLVGALR